MFYKYFCSSHIPEEENKQNRKTFTTQASGSMWWASRLDPGGWGLRGGGGGPAEHSVRAGSTPFLPSWEAGDLAAQGQVHASLANPMPLAPQTGLEGSKWALQGPGLPGYF